jgi:hypothetical protein
VLELKPILCVPARVVAHDGHDRQFERRSGSAIDIEGKD